MNTTDLYLLQAELDFRRERATSATRPGRRRRLDGSVQWTRRRRSDGTT